MRPQSASGMLEPAETAVEKRAWLTSSRSKKKTGGGKAPASPSEVSKLVADALPASVNPLEQEFDDDAGEQLDLRRDKDEREVITCFVEPSVLAIADLEATGKKGADKVTKKEENQRYSNFQSLLKSFQL